VNRIIWECAVLSVTTILRAEHDLIKSLLAVLYQICDQLHANRTVDPSRLDLVVEFLRQYADAFHHAKEETVLFPVLHRAAVPDPGGLIDSLLAEHTLGRGMVGLMDDQVEQIREGASGAAADFVETARAFVLLLLQHICKEDNDLFGMVDEYLDARYQNELAEAFGNIERDKFSDNLPEKFRGIVDLLRDEFGESTEIRRLCQ
jgi:hemerythrin-like domain-containing protein